MLLFKRNYGILFNRTELNLLLDVEKVRNLDFNWIEINCNLCSTGSRSVQVNDVFGVTKSTKFLEFSISCA